MNREQKLVLLIDTSSDEVGVALMNEDKVLVEQRWKSDPGAGRLLKEIDSIVGKEMKNIKKVVVCEGPGRRYSALRTGVVTGMMLASAQNMELASYTRKSSDKLFKDIRERPRVVIIPEYEKSL